MSDATAITTSAVRRGDRYLISGRKCFCTNGSVGDLYVLFAVTDAEAPKRSRLSAFVVDRAAAGLTIGRDEETRGTRGAPLSEVIREGVEVPAERLLGREGDGLTIAMAMLNESRAGAAAQCVGIGQAALDRALDYARRRVQGGRPIVEHQAVQLMLADMAIRTEAARALTRQAALLHDLGSGRAVALSAMCKTFASDAAVQTALDAIQVFGGSGYTRGVGVERLLRDAKAYQIFDGTNQIQRLTIARLLARES
jgi:acyl-CoA dehydrogenase